MPSYVRPGIRKCAKNRALSVVPGNSRIVLYAGNEVWCIGLGRMRDGRYYPQPLVKKSFDEVRKTGTVTHIVAAVETMGL